ncbi:NADP-dependent oxidoreductase [Dactylosporangium sp. CS-033363]|uniref:NADP-dependent oxidoreductase n=1 Tax=Dactylosporangium sp. CS-033363 TaxID=3239935 RepID=UPI003D9392FE
MPKAVVLDGFGPPDVLTWTDVPLPEPGPGQVRIRVHAAGVSPTDLAIRSGHLKAFALPPRAVLGFEAAGTVDALGPGVTGASVGDEVAALLLELGGYAEYALAATWTPKPPNVPWADAAALPSSAEAAAGVLRELAVHEGQSLVLFGGAGAVGIIATQLAAARGVRVLSVVRSPADADLARALDATPVVAGPDLIARIRAEGPVDAVFDAAGTGVLADAIALAGSPGRVLTLSDPHARDFGVRLSSPTPQRAPGALAEAMSLLAEGRLRMRERITMPLPEAAQAHRRLESGAVRARIVLVA